jgi:hypothetical protein
MSRGEVRDGVSLTNLDQPLFEGAAATKRDDLIEEGRAIPVARVQAMHEGKRRARARRNA